MRINNLDIRDKENGTKAVFVDGYEINGVSRVTIDFVPNGLAEITIKIYAEISEDDE